MSDSSLLAADRKCSANEFYRRSFGRFDDRLLYILLNARSPRIVLRFLSTRSDTLLSRRLCRCRRLGRLRDQHKIAFMRI